MITYLIILNNENKENGDIIGFPHSYYLLKLDLLKLFIY